MVKMLMPLCMVIILTFFDEFGRKKKLTYIVPDYLRDVSSNKSSDLPSLSSLYMSPKIVVFERELPFIEGDTRNKNCLNHVRIINKDNGYESL